MKLTARRVGNILSWGGLACILLGFVGCGAGLCGVVATEIAKLGSVDRFATMAGMSLVLLAMGIVPLIVGLVVKAGSSRDNE